VADVVRGEKRKVSKCGSSRMPRPRYDEIGTGDPSTMNRETIIQKLLKSGVWPLLQATPIRSGGQPGYGAQGHLRFLFDSANPLAPDIDYVVRNNGEDFQTGLNALGKLTKGKVHIVV
jgi:Na+-transporting NADH:ubiquinone oxidoreductase subunit A